MARPPEMDVRTLDAGADLDALIGRVIYEHEIVTDKEGNYRILPPGLPTTTKRSGAENAALPELNRYSTTSLLSQQAYLLALGKARYRVSDFRVIDPGDTHGEVWTLEAVNDGSAVVSASSLPLLHCRADHLLMVQAAFRGVFKRRFLLEAVLVYLRPTPLRLSRTRKRASRA